MEKVIKGILFFLGPMVLVICLALYLFPEFDKVDKSNLETVRGTIKSTYTQSYKGRKKYFIEAIVDGNSKDLMVSSSCLGQYEGQEFVALVYPDLLRPWFDKAWDFKLKSGKEIYSYEERVKKYENMATSREKITAWGIVMGSFVTPEWYFNRKRRKA